MRENMSKAQANQCRHLEACHREVSEKMVAGWLVRGGVVWEVVDKYSENVSVEHF